MRESLRRHFEVDAGHIVVATLSALASQGDLKPEIVNEAIRRYGSDRPDLRNPLELVDVADLMADVDFKVFAGPARDPERREDVGEAHRPEDVPDRPLRDVLVEVAADDVDCAGPEVAIPELEVLVRQLVERLGSGPRN